MKKDPELIKIIIIFIVGVTLMIALCVPAILRIPYPDWMVYGIAYLAFGGMAFIGISTFITSIKQKNIKPDGNIVVIPGVIVGHSVSKNNEVGEHRHYLPIYEYSINGETYSMKSDVATAKNGRDVGDKVQIVYNHKSGKAYCLEDAKRKKGYGFIFFIFGLAVIVLLTLKIAGVFG